MSINYCTIASQPIDGFCGTQRAKVLARLIERAHPVIEPPAPAPQPGIGGHGGTGGINFTPAPRPPFYVPPRRELDQVPLQYEQPLVTVTVEFDGVRSSQTLDMIDRLDFVIVTNFEILGDDDTVTVNIGEMEIR